jgi:NitT/TauT family transport system permease protein
MRLVNRKPSRGQRVLLGALPFVLVLAIYMIGSHMRLAENPDDKLLPSLTSMAQAFLRLAFEEDPRSGEFILWADTAISLWRLGLGMFVSLALALVLGVAIGFLPLVRATFAPFVAAFSLIPPITVLPILFIIVGLDEASKIALIVIGTAPVMIRSVAQTVAEIPEELIVKAQTLGASTWQMILRVILPMTWPRLITATRLALVPAWIFLISAEAIASTAGLGYRIFLVRRFLAMDVILPYVLWITLIAYLIDRLLAVLSARAFPWADTRGGGL